MHTNSVAVDAGARRQALQELVRRYERDASPVARGLNRARIGLIRGWRTAGEESYKLLKRQLDLAAALCLLLFCSPLLAAVAAAIKCQDGGPILYRQLRVGRNGRTFWVPKFRSMVQNADALIHQVKAQNHHGDSVTFKMKRDPRVTPVGRIIRRLSIDELPQLWCVLTGEMSLVGPRPALPREVDRYKQAERRRLEAAPGLTCIWQVSGRGDIPFARQVEMDVDYIDRQSLALDLKLLFLTVPAVLSGRGAY